MGCAERNLVDEAARLLNDAEPGYAHIRWSRADLLAYLNDAQCVLFLARPALFITTLDFELRAGAVQTLPPGVKLIYSIEGTVDRFGRVSAQRPSQASDYLSRWFTGADCSSGSGAGSGGASDYRLASYSLDAKDRGVFIVSPPVPAGQTVKVRARVLRAPDPASDDGKSALDCCYASMLLEWMLYRAYSVDDESQSSPARAGQHLQTFFMLAQIDAQAQRDLLLNKADLASVQLASSS